MRAGPGTGVFLVRSVLLPLLCLTVCPATASSQPTNQAFRESVILPTDPGAARLISGAVQASEREAYSEAAALLHQASTQFGNSLIRVEPDRYVTVAVRCQSLIARGTPEVRHAYRTLVDHDARRRFEQAIETDDERLLESIVRELFLSSVGDDAAFRLGQYAWERGQPSRAAACWRLLLVPDAGTERPASVFYPESRFDPNEIRARLILCDVASGNTRAQRVFNEFRRTASDAVGRLGRKGRLVDLLSAEIAKWNADAMDDEPTSPADPSADLGRKLWSVAWSPYQPPAITDTSDISETPKRVALTYDPIGNDRHVFVSDGDRILAFDAATGRPAWPVADDSGESIDDAIVFQSASAHPTRPVSGTPRNLPAIQGDRLVARVGAPVTSRSRRELQPLFSELVCLDIGRREGKVMWRASPDNVAPDSAFEGSPALGRGRVWSVVRVSRPSPRLIVVCLDIEDGRTIWSTDVCSLIESREGDANRVSDVSPILTECGVILATDNGAVVSLNEADGRIQWATLYERREGADHAPQFEAESQSVRPLFEHGMVFLAPRDSDFVFAVDASTGVILWRRELPDRFVHLLGIRHGSLILSGHSAWALNFESGHVRWGSPGYDVKQSGFGRGWLVGDLVLWPRRTGIDVLSVHTGRPVRSPLPIDAHDTGGGHLKLQDGRLLIAGPNQVTAFELFVD